MIGGNVGEVTGYEKYRDRDCRGEEVVIRVRGITEKEEELVRGIRDRALGIE